MKLAIFLLLSILNGTAYAQVAISPKALIQSANPNSFAQVQRLTPTEVGGGPYFGSDVSISGDTAVVGAYGTQVGANQQQGAAYVYQQIAGQWVFRQQLVSPAGTVSEQLGTAVAVRGDTIMIGVPRATVGGNSFQGQVLVFRRGASNWYFEQALTASDGSQGDQFGWSLQISGDNAIIGAYTDDVGSNQNQGSAYMYLRGPSGWIQKQKLTAPDGMADDSFGSVSLSGEVAVVGAPFADPENRGAAYVFVKNGTVWTLEQKITPSDSSPADWFGGSLAVYGGTIAVSSGNASPSPANGTYLFTKENGTWIERQKIVAPTDIPAYRFRVSSLNSEMMIASAARSEAGSAYSRGMAYVYARSGNTWSLAQRLERSGATNEDGFALASEVFGRTLLFGAQFADNSFGAGYIFEREATQVPSASITGRVLSASMRGEFPAIVTIEDSFGNLRYCPTNSFGVYRFSGLLSGSEYTLRVRSKRASYGSRTTVVESPIIDFNFLKQP